MKVSDIKIGRCYLIRTNELVNLSREKLICTLLGILSEQQFDYKGYNQKYLVQFRHKIFVGHSGLNYENLKGKYNQCWYVSKQSFIRELHEADILAIEL